MVHVQGDTKKNPIHYGVWTEIFKSVFQHIYVALNVIKLTYAIKVYKSKFYIKILWIILICRVQSHTKDFGYIMDNDWKWMDAYFYLIYSFILFYKILGHIMMRRQFIDNIQGNCKKGGIY